MVEILSINHDLSENIQRNSYHQGFIKLGTKGCVLSLTITECFADGRNKIDINMFNKIGWCFKENESFFSLLHAKI